jgi:transcriptional regulator with XRE-family HTH domain
MPPLLQPAQSDSDSHLLATAALRAADHLRLTHAELAEVIGVSPSVISKISRQGAPLPKTPKATEITLLFIRLYRALDAIVGGDDRVAAQWMRNDNTALHGKPVQKIKSVAGLIDTLAYLDARRALV